MGMMDRMRDWFAPSRPRSVAPPAIRADFMRGNRGVVFGGWRPALREASDDVGSSWDLAAARTIDLIQNSGWMAGALDQAVANTVGTGLQLKQRLRLNFGKDIDGKPFLSPWVPYAQIAGALKVHTPPSKGQQFTALSPNGDWQQAVALPMTWSDQNQSPSSKGDENVLTYGNVTATIKDDLCEVVVGAATLKLSSAAVMIKVGGVNIEVSDSGVAIVGGKVTHDGRNIGSTHLHGGVVPGGGLTDVPAN